MPDEHEPRIRTFLIADVRGYSSFTETQGDEAAARLAGRFAAIAREIVVRHGGEVVELRGDEALAVFDSARRALIAGVRLQERFVDETIADPILPLRVGIGLDTGEAIPVEGGFRGSALNVAARLCSLAAPGEVLATQELAHVATRIEGITLEERGPAKMKGITQPVRVVKVLPEGEDPSARLGWAGRLGGTRAYEIPDERPRRRRLFRRRRW